MVRTVYNETIHKRASATIYPDLRFLRQVKHYQALIAAACMVRIVVCKSPVSQRMHANTIYTKIIHIAQSR